jgi:hypothetical protein
LQPVFDRGRSEHSQVGLHFGREGLNKSHASVEAKSK